MPFVPYHTVRDAQWHVRQTDEQMYSDEAVQRAILLDIREQLRALNRVFACPNFLRIPGVLDTIARQTKQKRRKRKAVTK